MKEALRLLDQIIEMSECQDNVSPIHAFNGQKLSESAVTYHLRALKELLYKYDRTRPEEQSGSNRKIG